MVEFCCWQCGAASAADRDFERVVKAIEAHYGTHHANVPLMGVANFFVKVARPAGTSSFHLAVFDHLDAVEDDRNGFMDRLDSGSLLAGAHPIEPRGRSDVHPGGRRGKSTRMLIATFSRDAAMVVQVRVNAAALRRTIEHPDRMAKAYMGKHDDR